MTIENSITKAVKQAGGPSRVAAVLRVSSRSIANWQVQGYVPNFYRAEELANLANVPVETLRRPIS